MRHSYFGAFLLIFASCFAYSQTWVPVSLTPPVVEYSGSGEGVQSPNSGSTSYPVSMYYPTGTSPSGTPDAYGCTFRQSLSPTTGSIGSGSNAYPPEYPEWASGSSFTTTSELGGKAIPRGGITQLSVGYQAPSGSTAIEGIAMEASFPGSAEPANSSSMSFFWESDNCADGDTEYGFVLFPEGGSQITQFYYSYWSNCVDSPPGPDTCWAITYFPSINIAAVEQVIQCQGGVNMPEDLPISPNSSYFYKAYPYWNGSVWDFMAQVTDSSGNLIESCTVDPTNGNNTSCSPYPAIGVSTNTNANGGTCSFNPWTSSSEFDTSTFFNPYWTHGVAGWVFGVLTVNPSAAPSSPSVNGVAPVKISSIEVLE
jgi:hypothetical protein